MTFGSTFGRTFSPTFQPKSQAAAAVATDWWLAGGIPAANCIAAYQPKGAASYAVSLVNLANPGTYDATANTSPDFNAVTGWKFSADYLTTGIIPANDQSWSMIIKFSGATANALVIAGCENTAGQGRFYLWARRGGSNDDRLYGNGSFLGAGVRVADGVIAIAGANCYYNKGLDGTISTGWNVGAREIVIGGSNAGNGTDGINVTGLFDGYIQAVGIYDIDISDYIGELTDAINNIPEYSETALGVWSWFTQPVAVYYNNAQYFLPIDTVSTTLTIHKYIPSSNTHTYFGLSSSFGHDDHNNGSILVRDSDKKIIVFASQHNGTTISMWTSTNAEDISAWGSEVSLDASLGGVNYSYPCAIQLTGETNDPIYLFYRNKDGGYDGQHYSVSADGGATWAAGTKFFQHVEDSTEDRPYFQYARNGTDRIDFACTQGHPMTVTGCSIYHFYYTGGKWYKSDGTEITSGLPLEPAGVTQVYDGSTTEAWVWDIAINSSGNPVIVFATFPTPASDHRYNYAVWTGSAWSVHEICTAGGPLYAAETNYSGGVTIDKGNPNVIWCSRNSDSKWSIWKYTTSDGGESWTGSEQTTPTTEPQARPYCPDGGSEIEPLWWHGRYTTYDNSDCQIRYK